MIIFNKPIGINFCKIGKLIFNLKINKKISPFGNEIIEYIYDEKKAPRIMKIMGIVTLIQGFLFISIYVILNFAK